jgi:hypothetical protein
MFQDRILELNLGELRYYYRGYLVQDDAGVVKRHRGVWLSFVNQSSSIDFMGQLVLGLDGNDNSTLPLPLPECSLPLKL